MQILAELSPDDPAGRIESERAHEWLYIFKPDVAGVVLYVKLILRSECVVVSFHQDEGDDDEEA